eukprot:TRINITY_DN111191_c0_g1_i1.p1 TRINITY_DN111191_c0_g1~~TRINITY_DN111191_c0_g1_i1.p1  ORF type:complete len:172 (+),score=28.44 TRINITY_DN111191_c0_g1_i1:52-567(+)
MAVPSPRALGHAAAESSDAPSPPRDRTAQQATSGSDADESLPSATPRLRAVGGPTVRASSQFQVAASSDGDSHTDNGVAPVLAPPGPLPARPSPSEAKRKRRRQQRGLLERCFDQLQRPEVILFSVWWLIIFVITVYVADLGSHLRVLWKPLLLLASIPIIFSLALCILTL